MICISFLAIGCSGETEETETEEITEEKKDEITIMHVDAEHPEFQKFIEEAEEALDMEIHVTACPENADNRQARISTILSAGETSVDIFSVNDEMVSEFKYKGYLEPLNDRVMTEEIIACYPESYIKNIAMLDGEIYSVPYYMDIMVFWVNKSMTGDQEIRTEEDFLRLLNTDFGEGKYGYGSAWDSAYASIFAYSGTMNTFVRAGAYREDFIQVAPLPEFAENTTNIAAWQYVLNKASVHKEAAFRFLEYAASREGSIAYSEYMNRLPARVDIIREEDLDIPGFDQLRDYVENTQLKERPFSRNTMEDITSMGTLFQRYVLEEITQEEFCQKAQNITDNF